MKFNKIRLLAKLNIPLYNTHTTFSVIELFSNVGIVIYNEFEFLFNYVKGFKPTFISKLFRNLIKINKPIGLSFTSNKMCINNAPADIK